MRTVGYVECFVLSKDDVLSAIRDYPEAQVSKTCLRQTRVFEESIRDQDMAKTVIF